ncbi:MAG: L,D-transpeptidase [Verrucomicrobiota bacterium]
MRIVSPFILLVGGIAMSLLTGCETTGGGMTSRGGSYHVVAYKPHDPSNVRVKLSLSTQNVYVMEGDRLLMGVQGNIGRSGAATPTGHFTIYNKVKNKRRVSEPDAGYPMAYWCEFAPAYGFHEGFVWSVPRTHGCVRLHREAAARLFALTRIGTPVEIARSLPEDGKYGSQVRKLDQSRDPNPPRSEMMSASWFRDPPGPLLIDQ